MPEDTREPLRIMMLSQRLPPASCTGAPLQAWHLGRTLRARGMEVQITTTGPFGRNTPVGYDPMVPVTAVHFLDLPGAAAATRFARALGCTFSSTRWDVVHGHALSPLVLGAALRKGRGSAPFIVKPSIGGNHAEGEIRRIRRSPGFPLLLRALQNIELFAVLDDLIEHDLLSVGIPPERMVRVSNGVDLEAYHPADPAGKRELRHRHRIAADASLLLFCGQLSERKGVVELLQAWAATRVRAQGAVLAICGEGPLAAHVAAATATDDTLVYLGAVSDTTAVIRMADVLVLPSRCESFGNVILEALASGVPVAATATGVATRVLAGNRCGWLIPEPSAAAITDTLGTVLAERASWEQRARVGRPVAEGYSMTALADHYTMLYRRLAAVAAGRPAQRAQS